MDFRGLASGAYPSSTFANSHLARPHVVPLMTSRQARMAGASYAPPKSVSAVDKLRQAVREESWERLYETRETNICMRAEWSASQERCEQLQYLVGVVKARSVLEIGSFCGVGALAMAEALPDGGSVQVLELDPFVVSFGQRHQRRSVHGQKIKHLVGPAVASLETLVARAQEGTLRAFDMAVVDADKEGMREYFDTLWDTPGLLAEGAVVCVDLTPFKGQVPRRFEKFGFPYRWQTDCGSEAIAALRAHVQESPDFESNECGNLLIVRRK